MFRYWVVLSLWLSVACGRDEPVRPAPVLSHLSIDAGVVAWADASASAVVTPVPVPTRPHTRPNRERKFAQILLRSTPAGALASVDGMLVGLTPVLWDGELTGRAREFTFLLSGYGSAKYRFVPVTSGIVHGTLVKADEVEPVAYPPAGMMPLMNGWSEPDVGDAEEPNPSVVPTVNSAPGPDGSVVGAEPHGRDAAASNNLNNSPTDAGAALGRDTVPISPPPLPSGTPQLPPASLAPSVGH